MKAKSLLMLGIAGLLLAAGLLLWRQESSLTQAPAIAMVDLQRQVWRADGNLRGKVYLVNFWATTCAVCHEEQPDLLKTYQQFEHQNFEVLAVAMPFDPPSYVIRYAEQNSLPYRVVLDYAGLISKAFPSVLGTPTTFLINQQGQIVKQMTGKIDFVELRKTIQELLTAA